VLDLKDALPFAWHLLGARLGGRRSPLLAGFKVTHRCNCRCVGCPFWKMEEGDIPFSLAVQALDQLHELGVKIVILEGGEPFIWRDGERKLDALVEEARRRFIRVGITTNGQRPLEMGSRADIVWVSIDGLEATHDRLRGEGTFQRAMDHIAFSSHPSLFANVTINRANVDELPALVRFLSERVSGITIQFYYPYPDTENLCLEKAQRHAAVDQLIDLKRQGYPLLDSVAALRHLKDNTWRCHPWLIASVDPDGTVTQGCYLLNRAEVSCQKCGFAAHVEVSLAYDLHPEAILSGIRIFGL
jgi:MoaA/NifB/PqqE/SkfB family radical SAM enzyme